MKFLTLIAVNLVVLGVFWFRTESSRDSQGQSAQSVISTQEIPSFEAPDLLPANKHDIEVSAFEPTLVGDRNSREDFLKEYWELLLGEERDDWCPSIKVDMFKELEFIMTLDVDEAKEYLEALISLDFDWENQEMFSGLLINRIASKNPRDAVIFMLENEYEFYDDDYESVVRFWMDAEGSAVMDWFEKSQLLETKTDLSSAFYAAYAEENPYDFLVRYGSSGDREQRAGAAELLYESYGAEIYEDLKLVGLDPVVLGESFRSIGYQIYEDKPARARDWVMANRYSVDKSKVGELAIDMLGYGVSPNPEIALENFEWGYSNGLFSGSNYKVQQSLKRLGAQLPEASVAAVERLRSHIGDEATELMKLLPKPKKIEDEVYNLTPFRVEDEEGYAVSCFLGDIELIPGERIEELVTSLRNDPISDGSL